MLPHLFPEKCFQVDVDSDHLALTVILSSPWLPSLSPKAIRTPSSNPFCYNSIKKQKLPLLAEVAPPCSNETYNTLDVEDQEELVKTTFHNISKFVAPTRRYNKRSRN